MRLADILPLLQQDHTLPTLKTMGRQLFSAHKPQVSVFCFLVSCTARIHPASVTDEVPLTSFYSAQ